MGASRLGPSGGTGGQGFDEAIARSTTGLAAVYVRSGTVIDSLQVVERREERLVRRARHGGTGGERQRLALGDGEYLSSISGTYGDVVNTLRISTNRRRHALVAGREEGPAQFRYAAGPGGEIVGFMGRSATLLDALGVIVRPREGERRAGESFRCGPAGGHGGSTFDVEPPASDAVPRLLTVRADRFVDSIQIDYERASGEVVQGSRHGGAGGQTQTLLLERDEHITKVTGRFGDVIDFIQISTSKRENALRAGGQFRILEPRSPIIGGTCTFEAPDATAIVGFFGRAGDLIDALGVILRPL